METISYHLLTAIKKAIDTYYKESPVPFLPSQADYEEWLGTLLEDDQRLFRAMGMMQGGNVPSFRRYYFEKHGHELDNFLKLHLSQEAYGSWLTL